MSSCLLFHGPGARDAALRRASEMGRLVAPPFGDDGLKTDDARDIVELLLSSPIDNKVNVVVIGPMDEVLPKASDVLLKSIEEFRDDLVQPVLWANDLGGVAPTIRSRCLDHWAPSLGEEEDAALRQLAQDLVGDALSDNRWRIPFTLKEEEAKGKEVVLLGMMASALEGHLDKEPHRLLWERIRKAAQWRNPTVIEIVAALVCK